jgi:hypothetical protein
VANAGINAASARYTDADGNKFTSKYTGLLTAQANGTDKKTGATLYKLTLYPRRGPGSYHGRALMYAAPTYAYDVSGCSMAPLYPRVFISAALSGSASAPLDIPLLP